MTTYYLSPTGNDTTGAGTEANPWFTVTKANNVPLVAGDVVVMRGGVYNYTADQTLTRNGTSPAPITLRAATGEVPILDMTGAALGSTVNALFVSGNYNVVDGLHVRNSSGRGIGLYYTTGSTIRNCTVYNVQYRAIGGSGDSITIENNHIYNCCLINTGGGMPGNPGALSTYKHAGYLSGVTIRGNVVHDNWGEGIMPWYVGAGGIIEENVCFNNYYHNIYLQGCQNIIVRRNICYYTNTLYNFNGHPANSVMLANENTDLPTGGLANITIVNNLFVGGGRGFKYRFWAAVTGVDNTYSNVVFAYNVIYGPTDRAIEIDDVPADRVQPSGCSFRDNVVYQGPNADTFSDLAAWTISHNCHRTSLPAWDTSPYSFTTDPAFVNAGGTAFADYRPAVGSPLLMAGTPISGINDDVSFVARSATLPSVGIYEFAAAVVAFGQVSASAPEYKLILRTLAGVKTAELTDFLALRYAKRLNEPGLASFALADNHAALQYLVWRAQVEVWRRNPALGLDWYCDFRGLVADESWTQGPPGVVTFGAPGQLTMLGWRSVAWKAGVSNRTAFVSAKPETIAKTLVTYNATASATAGDGVTGRLRAGAISGATLTVQADAATGAALDWNCAYDNLLETLQKLAAVAQMDFDLVKTAAATWDFRWYAAQRGVDRAASLLFTPSRDNVADANYALTRRESKTAALVGGRNTGAGRDTVVRTGVDYSATYDVEVFVNAGGQDGTTAAYNAAGDRALDERRARPQVKFDVRQTPACYYGLHYCVAGELGDRVRWSAWTKSGTAKITGVNVDVRGRAEAITVETADV